MTLPVGIDGGRFAALLRLAREEDLGHGDVTTALLPEALQVARGEWELRVRQPGRICGAELIAPILAELAPGVRLVGFDATVEGRDVAAEAVLARLSGSVMQMLAAERTLLNFLQRLSGVATLTQRFVKATAGTHAKIYDTRKTLPGWRDLDRYAVRCGGGHSYRRGLHDAVLIKDNHLASVPVNRLAHAVFDMLNRIEQLEHGRPQFVEVEADSPEQFAELLKVVGIDVILLDNFTLSAMRRAVELRDQAGLRGKVELEASGGITLESVSEIARTGVERLAVGAITHSAAALDIGLDAV